MIWLALSACQHIFLELLNQRFRLWNAPSPPRRLFVVVCTCRRDTRSERARSWPDVVEMSGVRGGRATPLNSFNYKSKRTRCPRVGVSLECDVQSWHPSAPEESSRARRNLRQLFLHPRTARQSFKTDFWFTSSPSSSRASRGAKRWGGSLRHEAVSQKSVLKLWRYVRGQREIRIYIMFRWNTATEFLREWERVRARSPMSKYIDFRKGRFIK